MIVFVAGMPRAGSMWTYNIVRALLESKKFTVLPKDIPVDEKPLITAALQSSPVDGEVYTIKTHQRLMSPLISRHDIRIINNVRDVRDACLSFMRFTHVGFDEGLVSMQHMMDTTDYYQQSFKDNVLNIRFEQVIGQPADTIKTIAGFLDLDCSDRQIEEIEDRFSRESVKKKIDQFSRLKVDAKGAVKGAKHKAKYDAVQNKDGSFRIFDKSTSFQSNHITSKGEGEWRSVFTEEQTTRINALTADWLARYGYVV